MSYFPSSPDNNVSDCGGDLYPTDQNYISQPFHLFFNNESNTMKKNMLNTYHTTKSNIPTIIEEPKIFPSYLDPSPPENTKNLTENDVEYDRFQSDNLIGNLENNIYDKNISGRYYEPKNQG